jgi:hypothetical protein
MRVEACAGLLLLAAGSSCDGTGAKDSHVVVDTVAGAERVRNSVDARLWSLGELTRIAAAEGPASFGRIASVVADDRGNVYVADQQASEIRVFDAKGTHLRTIGRRGQGPGEFDELYSLAWMGDTLLALDPLNGRIGLLSPVGEWRGQIPHDRLTGSDIHLIPVGSEVLTLGVGTRGPDGRLGSHFVRISGATIDTIPYRPVPPDPARARPILCRSKVHGGMTFFSTPFLDKPLYEPAPGRLIAVANTAAYRIAFVDSTGDTVRVVEKTATPLPISDAEWESRTSDLPRWRTKYPDAACDRLTFERPAAKPILQDLFFDRAGRMWVEVTSNEGSLFDVFDHGGRQVGRVVAPERVTRVPVYATADRAYLVLADSLGVEEVRGYRLIR